MKIYYDTAASFYTNSSKVLNNAITIENNNKIYYYEFQIKNKEALIKTNDSEYIEDAVNFYRKNNKYIATYKGVNDEFYCTFDPVFTFKLPINILQPTVFFLSEERVRALDEELDIDNVTIPVTIIDDEYVILDGHHRLKVLLENNKKMVDVYMDKPNATIYDMVYVLKEHNIRNVNTLEALDKDEYDKYLEAINTSF